MEKIMLLFFLAIPVFGETYNLDYFINNQKKNELIEINDKKVLNEEEELSKKNYNDIKVALNNQKKIGLDEGEYIDLNLGYGDFNYGIQTKLEDNNEYTQTLGYGKNLNSLIYGEETYKINMNQLEKQIAKLNNQKTLNETNINIIKAYGDLLKIQQKINLQNTYKDNITLEKINIQKRYTNGDISSIDYDAFFLEEKSINIELKNLKKDYQLAKNELFSVSGVSFSDKDNLENLESTDTLNLENIRKDDLDILKLKKAELAETKKYNSLKNKPQFDFKADYTFKDESYVLGVAVSDTFEFKNFNKVKDNLDLDEIDYKINEEKTKIKELKDEYTLNYDKQILIIILDIEKLELERKYLVIKEKKYQLGEISYIDYLKEVEKFREKEIGIIEKKINLTIYLKKLAYY